ncbi:MAG: hypothetical protein DMG35_10105, partial [Acidobacteria bacterium]
MGQTKKQIPRANIALGMTRLGSLQQGVRSAAISRHPLFLLLCVLGALFSVPSVLSPSLFAQAAAPQETTTNKTGEALYKQRCAVCHEGGATRAPSREGLKLMSPENVRFALVSGSMMMQGLGLSSSQIADLIEFLTGKQPAKEQISPAAFCPGSAASFADPLVKPHWNGWGANLEQHRFQTAEMAQLSAEQVPKL